MRLRRGRGTRSASRFRASNIGPILKIAGIVVAAAGVVVLAIFAIKWIFGDGSSAEVTSEATETPIPTVTPIARADMSDAVEELLINNQAIEDPYVYDGEVVFSTTADSDDTSPTRIAVYDMAAQSTTQIEGITTDYDYLFEPKINENYIVYLDCKDEYGGAVCGYNRATGKSFVMREYKYGKPQVSLSGDYALWLQQTNSNTDRLYLYCLSTQESVEIEIFVRTEFFVSAPYMSKDAIIYVQPEDESKVLVGSSASDNVQICVMPLTEGGDANPILYIPGTFVYEPMITGDYIVFLDGPGDEESQLMYCEKTSDTYSDPVAIAQGVLNYYVGDGFVAYTLDEAVYIYYFKDGSSGQLSSKSSRAFLKSANGKDVVWYDITNGLDADADVVMHIEVP